MPTMAYVEGHGTVPKFRDEHEMQAYDAGQLQSGKGTFPTGVKFGVERTVTAVKESGKAILKTNVLAGSAPLTMMGAYEIGGVPFVANKPVVSEVTFASPGTYYGIAPMIIVAIIILIIVISLMIGISCILSKMHEMKDPDESGYTDSEGCNHTVYTGGGGFLGASGTTDLNQCTGKIENVGGWAPFGSTTTGTDLGSQLSRAGIAIVGVCIVAGIGYVVYKKYGPQIKAKVAPTVAKGKAVVAKGKAVAGAVKKEVKKEPEPKKEGA
jgi:hypothetical protein